MLSKGMFLVFIPFILSVPTQGVSLCREPAKNGESFMFVKTVKRSNAADVEFLWERLDLSSNPSTMGDNGDDKYEIVAICHLQNETCSDTTQDVYISNVIRIEETDSYNVSLTIKKVVRGRDRTTWKWKVRNGRDENNFGECRLEVFAFDAQVTCQEIRLDEMSVKPSPVSSISSITVASWTCSMSNVYPSPNCRFEYSVRNNSGHEKTITVNKDFMKDESRLMRQGTLLEYEKICKMTVPVSSLDPGEYRFRVIMQAVSSLIQDDDLTQLMNSSPLTFDYPKVAIKCDEEEGDNFKDGYLKQDTQGSCVCSIQRQGNPPGQPDWYDSKGRSMGRFLERLNDKQVTFQYNPMEPMQAFTCRGISPLGQGEEMMHIPKFAYGPSFVSMFTSDHKASMALCKESNTIRVFCEVDRQSTFPQPIVRITDLNGSQILKMKAEKTKLVYRFRFDILPKAGGGTLTLKCTAKNAIFNNIAVNNQLTVSVLVPPRLSPIITINGDQRSIANGSIETKFEDQTILLKCEINGGYPPVEHIKIDCGVDSKEHTGNVVEWTLAVGRKMNGAKCVCETSHITRCYTMKTQFYLNVHYPPSNIKFTANYGSHEVELSAGEMVAFVCEADGNPSPNLKIQRQRSTKPLAFAESSSTIGYNITRVKCADTDKYICSVSNDIDRLEKSVSIFVKCAPESASSGDGVQQYPFIPGSDLKIDIPIRAYPVPDEFVLSRVSQVIGRPRRNAGNATEFLHESSDEFQYNVTYHPGIAPDGIVRLILSNLKQHHSGQFLVSVRNGIGEGLQYKFSIHISSDSANHDHDTGHLATMIAGVAAGLVIIILIILFALAILFFKRKGTFNNSGMKKATGKTFGRQDKLMVEEDYMVEIPNLAYGKGTTPNKNQDGDYYSNEQPYAELNDDEIVSLQKPDKPTVMVKPTIRSQRDIMSTPEESKASAAHGDGRNTDSESDYEYI